MSLHHELADLLSNLTNFILFFIFLFQQYLNRGAQFSEAGLNGALFNINLHTNNILQNTKLGHVPFR